MDAAVFVVITAGLGALCSIPGIVVGKWLASRGIVRETPIWLLVTSICMLFVLRILLREQPLWFHAVLVTVLVPLGIYRQDLWTYFRAGKFPGDTK
jgi:hypothetical protein